MIVAILGGIVFVIGIVVSIVSGLALAILEAAFSARPPPLARVRRRKNDEEETEYEVRDKAELRRLLEENGLGDLFDL